MSALAVPLPILQGERCLLRALAPEDAPALVTHANDREVARNLFDAFPQPCTLAAADAWATHESHSGAFGWVWGIVADGAVVGCIGLHQASGWMRCNAEIGYWLGRAYWRRGITSDAVRQVTDWAFAAVPELTRIHAPIFASNDGSQAVVRKCGYVREGLLKQSAIKDGAVIDRVVWATYRTEIARRDADIGAVLAATAATAMERA
ncbi:GNAT family N-acetyltransferase [Scleromatobacter humisilvae]|uniref:GNAT family N-acetyltransferase n=1 Tax=Scleromatobacter humisilvae TaxID=2897159 RepID=A0A9X1YNI6_9BURK|nr:GNAT family N-acetyltransferase [Scleromatobacter humisilvae]MCK9689067.1 GNAT family N-acetyltransferase [Scleromatobacter humisilvae]